MGLNSFARDEDRWAAVLRRDKAADGRFYYSVRTTGVYCRPSCAARPAKRENVAFHESAEAAERAGFRPCKRCRPVAAPELIRFAVTRCSLGLALIAATERGVCAVLLGNDSQTLERDLRRRFPRAELLPADARVEGWVGQVLKIIERPGEQGVLPLDLRGTELQRRVWRVLGEIPVGETLSYAEVAKRVGAPRAVRAVAQACGANAHAIVIPCHRVVRSDGSISGYRWGVERKRALLGMERKPALLDAERSRALLEVERKRSVPGTARVAARHGRRGGVVA